MIISGFYHIIRKEKAHKSTFCVVLSAAFFFSFCFCCLVPSVMAEKESLSPLVDSVNLRQDKWVYSIYVDKSNSRYASVARYDGDEIDIEIPAELGGIPVKAIGREAFCGCQYITSVVIPDSVTDIDRYAFRNCIGLSRVTFPDSLVNIGEGAFYGCRSLTGIVLPEKTVKIGSFAFYDCIHLSGAVFPSSLRSIGDSSFERCAMLQDVVFGDKLSAVGDMAFKGCASITGVDLSSVGELGAGAFMKCASLTRVVLGDALTELYPETFRNCAALEKVQFGQSIEKLGTSAFEGCSSLKALPALDSLTDIGALAFKGCSSMSSAVIGKNVKNISSGAFLGCASLAKIQVSEENASFSAINGCLYDKDGATLLLCPQGKKGSLRLADSATRIEDYAAVGCAGLSAIVFGGSLDAIGNASFFGCTDLTSLSIPESVESIGYASMGCYRSGGRVWQSAYLRVFGDKDGVADRYCAERGVSFTPYESAMVASSERVVLAEGTSFVLLCGFLSCRQAEIAWESSDESVVRVSGGRLTAVAQGNAEITASAEGFSPCVIKVVVVSSDDKGTSTKRTHENRLIYCGETEELSSLFSQIIDPIFSANRFWFSSAPSVATVTDDGRVAAHSSGIALITCRMPDGSENTVMVTVTERPAILGISAPEKELVIGKSVVIGKSLCPSMSKDTVAWKSDDESVATVDENGRITAVGQGKCTVTATSASGLESSAEVKCVIPVTSLSLDREIRNVYQGKEFNLKVSLTPQESDQRVVWKSSDASVATVNSKGKVVGRSFGSAIITAETAAGVSAQCRVNVVAKAEELSLDTKKLKINQGTEFKLNAIIRPSYSPETTDKCKWNSTNEKVATVDENGVVSAVSPGKCIINCRTGGDLISKCQVQVRLPAQSLRIFGEEDSLYIGESVSLTAQIAPENSTDTVEWSCDNEEVAVVSNGGTVKGKASGVAHIIARVTNDVTGDSITDSFEIKVLKKADSVTLNRSSISLTAGENDFLVYSLLPDDCNDSVRWYSTDENVALVRDDGLITAVAPGSCYIYAESGSGVSARCKITVNDNS